MTTSRPLPRPTLEAWFTARRLLKFQLYVTITAAVLCGMQSGAAGYSALSGGLIAILGQVYFTVQALKYVGARQAHNIVKSFYQGVIGKWLLTLGLFACALLWMPGVNSLVMFLTYGLVISVHLLVPWLEAKPKNESLD